MDDVAVEAIRERMAMSGVTYAEAAEWYLEFQEQEQMKEVFDGVQEFQEHELANIGSVHDTEKGSGARYNKGKPPLHYIPVYMVLRRLTEYMDHDSNLHRKVIGALEVLACWQERKDPVYRLVCGLTWEDYEEAAYVWEYGADKYAAWNWAKGMPWSVPVGCILRHARDIIVKREEFDPESGHSHWGHIVCNIQMLEHFTFTYPEGDDRPPKEIW